MTPRGHRFGISARGGMSRRAVLALALAGGFLFAGVDIPGATAASSLYVLGGRTLSIVDTENPSVVARIPVATLPPSSPRSVASHPNGRVVYVSQGANGVAVVDRTSRTVIATVPMGARLPTDLILSPDGRSLFVAGRLLGVRGIFVSAIDTETLAVSEDPAFRLFGGGGGSLVGINASGTKLYLIGASASFLLPSVEVVDATTRPPTPLKSIAFPFADPVAALVVHPAGTRVYAARSNAVSVIDGVTDAVIGTVTLDVSGRTTALAMDPRGGSLYVLQILPPGGAPGRLVAIDTHTNAVSATVSLPIRPGAAAIDVGRGKIYVAGDDDDCSEGSCSVRAAGVTVVDATAWQVVKHLPAASSSNGIASTVAIDPQGTAVHVLDSSGRLTVIDPATDTVSASLPGGAAMAVGPARAPVVGGLHFYLSRTGDGAAASVQFGAPGDRPVPADYDGDGRVDLAVFRPREGGREGLWYIARSSDGAVDQRQWGAAAYGDVPVLADYDGDGRADLAVWRPATDGSGQGGIWYLVRSSDRSTVAQQWGAPDDVPVPADYDGDGRADLAVWRAATGDLFAQGDSGTWFVIGSADGTTRSVQLGALGDVPVPADYDGDGRADLAVWRPTTGEWLISGSRTGVLTSVGFGAPGDVPVPRDYDGDGRADLAVWRPHTGGWFIQSSRSGLILGQGWGASGDLPVPDDYDGDGRADLTVYRP